MTGTLTPTIENCATFLRLEGAKKYSDESYQWAKEKKLEVVLFQGKVKDLEGEVRGLKDENSKSVKLKSEAMHTVELTDKCFQDARSDASKLMEQFTDADKAWEELKKTLENEWAVYEATLEELHREKVTLEATMAIPKTLQPSTLLSSSEQAPMVPISSEMVALETPTAEVPASGGSVGPIPVLN
ncbi:hypothetical protein NE237_032304 [Protea cynaroides]|uniref:Uncharacterized protein n=1 Tax=Protea cynaroides TaxID=273540 RepID=A0A9Q0L319_9MAGN|nr:hypothetical protein NE237_032304 [Protea cynaroides]